jgi:FHS family L-fucose permease-like MFS transporter
VVAAIFVVVGVLIALTHLPEVHEVESREEPASETTGNGSLLAHPHLLKGVVAQFFYVGAQVGVASFVIRYAQHSVPGMAAKTAAIYLLCHQIGFMLGRFIGSGMMKRIAAPRLLAAFAAGSLLCTAVALLTSGLLPVLAVVLIGFFHSIMFPTIFALSIKNLGPLMKRGSSLLVMAIIGGAVFPALMGRISDAASIQTAFVVPLICYAYILYFAVAGYKPELSPALSARAAEGEGA